LEAKFIIYQLLPRIFGNTNSNCVPNSSIAVNGCGKFNDITSEILNDLKNLGVTHIWYTGIIEHATKTDYYKDYNIPVNNHAYVKGEAGSPYAIKDYFDVDPDLAVDVLKRREEFDELVKRTHNCGLKVIIDLVPNHLAREYMPDKISEKVNDFDENNLFLLEGTLTLPVENTENYREIPARATGNNCFSTSPSINDWYDTVKLNYNNPGTHDKMLNVVLYWASLGVDGLRCDMAEMVPTAFWIRLSETLKVLYPEFILIGEIYDKGRYREFLDAGFDYLYDKSGMYEILRDVSLGRRPASEITSAWQSIDSIQDRMLNFLENHDEVRIASDFFLRNAERGLPAVVVSLLLNRAPFMLYSGQELGERGMYTEGYSGIDGKSSIFDYWSMESIRNWIMVENIGPVREQYSFLLNLAINEKAFSVGKTFDLTYANPDSRFYNNNFNYSFLRYCDSVLYIVCTNFGPDDMFIKLNIPVHAFEYFGIMGREVSDGKQNLVTELPFQFYIKAYSYEILKFKVIN
jgi:glycosidase